MSAPERAPKPQAELQRRKPPWLKVRAPGGEAYARLKRLMREQGLHTVCEEARCPNVGECWGAGTATVLLLGDVCTRACRFCDVRTAKQPPPPDADEPDHVARAVRELGLRYVVLTMVDRDDLCDGGAGHVAATVAAIKREAPETLVELLTGDFAQDEAAIARVAHSGADVLAHNVEVVERLQPLARDPRCSWARSLAVLERMKALAPGRLTKSSLMVGLGETAAELTGALEGLRAARVDIVTIGQYLRPAPRHLEVVEYVPPERFAAMEAEARALGFAFVACGPLVRSSYRAAELFVEGALRGCAGAARPERPRAESR